MALRFDHLITALSGAVVEAQHQVQQAHIGDLWKYFSDGSPISVEFQVPRKNLKTGEQERVPVGVPLITLLNHSQLSIQEMQITMQVDMSEITEAAARKIKKPIGKASVQPYQWKPLEYKTLIAASTTTGKQPSQAGMAQVTLTVKAEQTPEGLARLLDHLHKSL